MHPVISMRVFVQDVIFIGCQSDVNNGKEIILSKPTHIVFGCVYITQVQAMYM
jgi:hypothetical protein